MNCELCGRPDCPTIPPPPPKPGAMLVGGGKVGEHVNFTAVADCRAAIRRNLAALQAAAKAVGELPEYLHTQFCLAKDRGAGPCSCYVKEANAKRLAARKAVGLEG